MSVFWTAAIATRRIFRVAGLRCQRTALQSKDCLRKARGDFNPDPLHRRSALLFQQPTVCLHDLLWKPLGAMPSPHGAESWGRTSTLRLIRTVHHLLCYIGVLRGKSIFVFFIFSGWPVSKLPGSFSGTPF